MPEDAEPSQAREQVLEAAERLFSQRGYTAVTLKDIAQVLGVRQAALYYHVPQGKEQLFVEATSRSFSRHRTGIGQAIAQAEPRLAAQLHAIAAWLVSQPPLDMSRLARSDLPALSEAHAQQLYAMGDACLSAPIQAVIAQAYQRGEIRMVDTKVITTVFLSMIDTIHDLQRYKDLPKEVLARDLIEVLLDGLHRR